MRIFLSKTKGSPLLVETITHSSSGITPIKGIANISFTSATDIISLALTICGLKRFTNKVICFIPFASNKPITLSASRTAAISGVVTTIASLAGPIAL